LIKPRQIQISAITQRCQKIQDGGPAHYHEQEMGPLLRDTIHKPTTRKIQRPKQRQEYTQFNLLRNRICKACIGINLSQLIIKRARISGQHANKSTTRLRFDQTTRLPGCLMYIIDQNSPPNQSQVRPFFFATPAPRLPQARLALPPNARVLATVPL
jgi:hypothetical protein